MELKTIILAGGFGKRLAPLSTEEKPKQFHDLTGAGISLFQQSVLRALKISAPENIYPVANVFHKTLVLSQLAAANNLVAQNVIFEKEPRNTAYAIALAAKKIGQGIIVIMPSDHEIEGNLAEDIEAAAKIAATGKIVTFGIVPDSPDTNYGYLLEGGFHEKPEQYQAEVLISQGALWNSGIFVASAETVLQEFEKFYGADIENIPAISFDKAVMEKTDKMVIKAASFKWADLGSWESLKNYGIQNQKLYA